MFAIEGGVTASLSGLTISGGFRYGSYGGLGRNGSGGGLVNYGTATLTDCTISGNSVQGAGYLPGVGVGGGLFNVGTVTLAGCTITGNVAVGNFQDGNGGGLFNSGTATLADCTISGNDAAGSTRNGYYNGAGNGGGLWNDGTVTLADCTIIGNVANAGSFDGGSGNGGGLSNYDGTATLAGCTITGNYADGTIYGAGSGGGLESNGSAANLFLSDCTISGNDAKSFFYGNYVMGGGLLNSGTATLSDCTISGNYADNGSSSECGGLLNVGTATLADCTISGNALLTISNSSPGGVGGLENGGTATLTDTIIAGNTDRDGAASAASDVGGANVTGKHNLIGTGGSGGIVNGSDGNIVLTSLADLDLGPLADNGGPTETMALLPGSAAIHAGIVADDTQGNPITTDQRGLPLDSPPDIGAFQVQQAPTIYTVDSTGSSATGTGTSGTLPYVISLANANPNTDGSEIEFDPSVFSTPQTITLAATLVLSETSGPEVIDGIGANLVTVSGGGKVTVFDIKSGVAASLSGLTISGGSTTRNGGGVLSYGTATLSDCTISGNSAFNGGGMDNYGPATLSDCTISENSARYGGGLGNVGTATATLSDCTISGNSARNGGGVANYGKTAALSLSDCTISGNSAPYGGGLENSGSGMATLSGCTISGNSSRFGGGLGNVGTATLSLSDCTISDNSAPYGGGLGNFGTATLSLTGCTVSGNSARDGGGLNNVNTATATFSDCTISGNSARYGGGLYNDGTAMISDCTISGNSARYGGGLNNLNTATATLSDCTISGNSARFGGGLGNFDTATLSLTGCTVGGNSTYGGGGGLYNEGGTAALTDTIVAGNTYGSGNPNDIVGARAGNVAGTHNLIGIGGSGGIVNGSNGNIVLASLTNLDLGPLANNGGPTETMALLPGSAAIHVGIVIGGVTTDQRGLLLDSPPDVGAYQVQTGSLAVSAISAVTPATRNTAISSLTVTLNEPAGLGGFTAVALTLTDNGGPNLITGAVTITLVSGYDLRDQRALRPDRPPRGVTRSPSTPPISPDQDGNPGTGSLSTSWLMDTTPPTSTCQPLPKTGTSLSFPVIVTGTDPERRRRQHARRASPRSPSTSRPTAGPGPVDDHRARCDLHHSASATATFTGLSNTTYAFYTTATDAAGNAQAYKPVDRSLDLPARPHAAGHLGRSHHRHQSQLGRRGHRDVHARTSPARRRAASR